MEVVTYTRHEPFYDPEDRVASLLHFVLDVPHLTCWSIFPPHHILNQHLQSGGSPGGMGPGATWTPFQISDHEYNKLLQLVLVPLLESNSDSCRYAQAHLQLDPSLDHIQDRYDWMRAVTEKHRSRG